MPYYNVSNKVRTFLQLRWSLLFLFPFFFWSFFYEHKIKKRSIPKNRLMCHNITSLPRFYKTKKVLQHGAYLSSAQVISAFSFFLFFGISFTRTKSSAERSISQNRFICHHYKVSTGVLENKKLSLGRWLPHRLSERQSPSTTTVLFRTTFTRTIKLNLLLKWLLGSNLLQQNKKGSATWCVPSSSSSDFCFFLFRFSFGVSSTTTKSSEWSISQNRFICHHYKVSVPWFYKTKRFCNKARTLLRRSLLFPFPFFFWSFFYENKKQRKISFLDPLDMSPLKSFYPGLTKQKRSTTRCVPSSNSGDLCFFLFPFFFGVSSTRTKSNERSVSQNRLIRQHYKVSTRVLPNKYRFCDQAIRCVPSSKSGDLCFFSLPFSFRVSSTRTRRDTKRSITCRHYKFTIYLRTNC